MAVSVKDLTYIYMKGSPFEKKALDNISLDIDDGEFVGIIGHTGSGKSTLIQHFNGLLKPSSGRVVINGVDVAGKNLKDLRKKVGIVFQYPEYQFFEETVYRDIAFGLHKQGLSENEVKTRVNESISAVGLDAAVLDKSPFELSGGQKKRLSIAEILVMRPEILIMDEPTAGLDPKGRDDVFSFVRKYHKSAGITTILVSHYMEDIARLVDRVIVLNKGSIAMDGPVGEIFDKTDELDKMGLSAPQVTYLMKRLHRVFPEIKGNVYTVEEARRELLDFAKGRKPGFVK